VTQVITIDGVNRASVIRYPGSTFDSGAWNGEAGTGSLLLEDEAAALDFPGLKIVRMTEDASGSTKHLYRGRVMTKEFARGSFRADDSHQKVVNLSDSNWDLRRLRVHQWSRPAESGRARVVALAAYILNGSSSTVTNATKRNTTVIDASTYVPNTNLVTMDARVYDSTDPYAVIEECARAEGKTFFVFVDATTGNMMLFYDLGTSTAIASTVSITDEDPDGETTFAPAEDGSPGAEDPTELLSGAGMVYGEQTTITEARPAIASAHDVAEDTIYDSGAGSDAATRLSNFLDVREEEELRYSCSIEVRDDQAHLIQAGQTISFRWAAANALTPTIQRIVRCAPEKIEPDRYRLHLELSFPEKVRPRIQNHGQGTVLIRPQVATYENVSFSTDHDNFYTDSNKIRDGDVYWLNSPADLRQGAGTEYDIYDYDADAVCGATVQLRDPKQTFAATLLTFTSVTGTPVRVKLTVEWDREDPPLGPRPQAKQWMPILVTCQELTAGDPIPIDPTLYGGIGVRVLNETADSGSFDFRAPVGGSGSTRYIFVVFRPLWELASDAVCGHPDDWGASEIGAIQAGAALEQIASAGWVEAAPLGARDGLETDFDLAGDVQEIEWVTKNGLEMPETEWEVDTSGDAISFVTAPKASDLVIVRYRVA
jgi:hypothetical protein